MLLKDILGKYKIEGTNQDETSSLYNGSLELFLNDDESVGAKWLIGKDQNQFGKGFFRDNILIINFNYLGDNDQSYKGTVVYKCITKNILDGFWAEELGNYTYLGSERCYRVRINSKEFS